MKGTVHIYWGEEDHQCNRTVGEGQNVSFGHAKFERLIGHPSGDTHPSICRAAQRSALSQRYKLEAVTFS